MENQAKENEMKGEGFAERNLVNFKFLALGMLALVLLIPATLIRGLIEERRDRRESVIREITGKWGGEQWVVGPMLRYTFTSTQETKDGRRIQQQRVETLLPETYRVEGALRSEIRKRGIFETVLYASQLVLRGTFLMPDGGPEAPVPQEGERLAGVDLVMDLSDFKGIRSAVTGTWGERPVHLAPGSGNFGNGRLEYAVGPMEGEKEIPFEINLDLNGVGGLFFVPVGKTTQVALSGDWDSPSFSGAFLPSRHEVTDDGFSAEWTVLEYNRGFPRQWSGANPEWEPTLLGLNLIIPADIYQQTHRTAKYAIIFILFTFSGFFIAEIICRERVHPIQYMMIGSGLVVFYLLLLSFSEHLGFVWAYTVAGLATAGLLGWYAGTIMNRPAFGLGVAGILGVMYGYLYILLQSSDYALILGSVAVFAVLATLMVVTRQVDWYGIRYSASGTNS